MAGLKPCTTSEHLCERRSPRLLIALLGAQARPPAPTTVRMYVFDCGVLKIADPMPLFGLKKEEVGATDLSDAAYLIVHPRGTLMWEAGLVPDSQHRRARNARPGAPSKTLKDSWPKSATSPRTSPTSRCRTATAITPANANDFKGSTWLVNKAEHDAMFMEKAAAVLHRRPPTPR